MSFLLAFVLLIFILFIYLGYRRGLILSVCKVVLTILSFFLAYLIAPIVSSILIEKTPIDNVLHDRVYKFLESKVEDSVREKLDAATGKIDEALVDSMVSQTMTSELSNNEQLQVIKDTGLPKFMQDALIAHNNNETKNDLEAKNFFDYMATYITHMIMNGIGFLVSSMLLILVFMVLMTIIAIATKLPVINGFNRIGGVAFGIVEALFIIWAVFVLIAVSAHTSFGGAMYKQVEANGFLNFLYDKNIFLKLLTNLGNI